MVPAIDEESLTDIERSVVQHVVRGELIDLVGVGSTAREVMRVWDGSHTVRALVIREISRGRLAQDPDPRGIRIRGARITGRLDLENVTSDVGLELIDCIIEDGIHAYGAKLPQLGLVGCLVIGEVNLGGAHLGLLNCEGATLRNANGSALYANGAQIDHAMILMSGFNARGAGDNGAVHLSGARVGGWLNCKGAVMRNESGPALKAKQATLWSANLSEVVAVGAGVGPAVDLERVEVAESLLFEPEKIEHETEPRLRLVVDGMTYCGLPNGYSLA